MRVLFWVLIAGMISGFVSPFVAGSMVRTVELINTLWGEAIVLAPVIAFWVVGVLARYSKKILGTGVDSYKDESVHINLKDLILKYVSTIITLGFGGSGGLVSPILFIGKGMSNVFSRKVERIFTISFASGMLTYYLGAPLTASLLSVEYFEKDTVSYDDLMPALLSAMISDFHAKIMGFRPIFIERFSDLHVKGIGGLSDILLSLVFAVVFGGVGMLAYLMKYSFRRFVGGLDLFRKTLLSGLLVSLVGIIFGREILGLKVFLGGENVVKLTTGKILATVFTIESLGSSGYFTPLTVVGMNLGLALHLDTGRMIFSVVGVSALLSSMLNIPIAAVIFPVELFGYGALIPAAIGSSVSYILFKRFRLE